MSRKVVLSVAALCLGSIVCSTKALATPDPSTIVRRDSNISYCLDKSSVQVQGALISYWILVTFEYESKFDSAQPYKSARLLIHADCRKRVQDEKSILQYHSPVGHGVPVWAQTFDEATMRMEKVEPGSVGAQILEVACSIRN